MTKGRVEGAWERKEHGRGEVGKRGKKREGEDDVILFQLKIYLKTFLTTKDAKCLIFA